MLDVSSSALTSPAVQAAKPTAIDAVGPDTTARTTSHKGHVQAWMPVTIASSQTAEAILELPIGGPAPTE